MYRDADVIEYLPNPAAALATRTAIPIAVQNSTLSYTKPKEI